jgi:hypothetical protein
MQESFPVFRMVGAEGFEPPTPWSQAKCATKLRYAPLIDAKIILSHTQTKVNVKSKHRKQINGNAAVFSLV